MRVENLVEYLDRYLGIPGLPDYPNALNGLQVANSGRLSKLAVAVDAASATIERAASSGADFMLVHHGLFWAGNQPVTGARYRRLRGLIGSDMALYAAHLPLDSNPEVGNNVVLARSLGIEVKGTLGSYAGHAVGIWGELEVDREELQQRLAELLGGAVALVPGGPRRIHRIGVITGGAGSETLAARDMGLDAFITGEGSHHNFFDAEEGGINLFLGGHYATEVFGVKALAQHIETQFGLPWCFIDHPTGL